MTSPRDEVDVLYPKSGELVAAHPGQEQPDDRVVADVVEGLALGDVEQGGDEPIGEHRRRLGGPRVPVQRAVGVRVGDVELLGEPGAERAQVALLVVFIYFIAGLAFVAAATSVVRWVWESGCKAEVSLVEMGEDRAPPLR